VLRVVFGARETVRLDALRGRLRTMMERLILGDHPQGAPPPGSRSAAACAVAWAPRFALMDLRVVLAELGRALDATAVDAGPRRPGGGRSRWCRLAGRTSS